MAVQYTRIPTSINKLSFDAMRLIDMYQNSQLPEEDMIDVLKTWKENVPELIFEQGDTTKIRRSLSRLIGKKREKVLSTLMLNMK